MIEWFEKNRKVAILITFLIAIEIFAFSSIPGSRDLGIQKINLSTAYHFIVFFLFGFFLLISVKGKQKIHSKHLVIVILISATYAILDEIHQIFVPFRSSSVGDVFTDVSGILMSIILHLLIQKKR